ncbi:hypothetical protein [Solirubrobacter soli]|uniref:hypothetical protein n=1 Tax=Solirubrobacter soli TaxID=363832 RepID=UPI000481EE45|nr:hypothetical protein [Solirubrobacter soli]
MGFAAVMALGVTPAQATVVDRGSFEGSETVPDPQCGIALTRSSTFSGNFRVRVDKASGGQAFFQRLNFDYRDVFTNAANGKTMTFEGHSVQNEIAATPVGGNVYEFTVVEAGQPFVVRDGAGRVVLRDRGVLRHRVVFDTLGDGTPGGVTIDDEVVAVGGPHPGFDMTEEQFCAMVTSLVG